MKKKKVMLSKAMAAALSLSMAVAMCPVTAMAEGTEESESVAEEAPVEETEAEEEADTSTQMSSAEIGGVTYYYIDTAAVEAPESAVYTAVDADGNTVASYEFAALTNIEGTTVYYAAAPDETPLAGELTAFDTTKVISYEDVYAELGVDATAEEYDVVSSATNFTSRHANDIPAIVSEVTDGDQTVINGVYAETSVDAVSYVEVQILEAVGAELTDEQQAVANVVAKGSGSQAEASYGEYSYSSKYGNGEFVIYMKDADEVEGYVWNDFLANLYAVTISDGETTVGGVHWIDIYGESATSGYHYNKVEIAVNNGTSLGSNEAEVSRYAAFYADGKDELKPGDYTVTLYANGYDEPVATTVHVKASYDKASSVTGTFTDLSTLKLFGISELQNPTVTVSHTEGQGRDAVTTYLCQGASVASDGTVALETAAEEGVSYNVTVANDEYQDCTFTLDAEVTNGVEMSSVDIAGLTYYYVDLAGVAEKENVTGVIDGTKVAFADMTQLPGTDYYYAVADGKAALTGTLSAFDTDKVVSYKDVYAEIGVDASAAEYDVVSSATNFTSFHAKDVPAIVNKVTEDDQTVIKGVYEETSVEADDYVKAMIYNAEGERLTAAQQAMLSLTVKASGSKAEASYGEYSYSCKYGNGEFVIYMKDADEVEGYVWNDFLANLYAATISDGTTTVGGVHWIDIYGESATSGFHYNKVEIAVNNGTSLGANEAEVSRYAAFYADGKDELKPGDYTVTLYAAGYDEPVSTTIHVKASYDNAAKVSGKLVNAKSLYLGGISELENCKVTVSHTEGQGRNAVTTYLAQNAEVVNGYVTLETAAEAGVTYNVTIANDEYQDVALTVTGKETASVTLKNKTATYTGKAISVAKATVTGTTGAVTYTYYTDKSLKTKTTKANSGASATGAAPKNAGTYYVKAKAAADDTYYAAAAKAKIVINKADAKIVMKVTAKSVSYSSVKKAAKTFSLGLSATSGSKVTAKKVSGSKYLTVTSAGTVKVAKGTPKGTYSIKVKMTSAKTSNYNAGTRTKTVKVTVK